MYVDTLNAGHMIGHLVAFEGLDQSGKQTQAESLRDHLMARGHRARLLAFPDYATHIGDEISRALHGERDYAPDVLQLLYVANRYEKRQEIADAIADGQVLLCDRYMASSIAYGEAHGLDPEWLTGIQRFLPMPDLTILLDIAPATAAGRKAAGRDRFERDLALLARVRSSYQRQAADPRWVRLDGERSRADIAADVIELVSTRLGRR